MQKRIGIAAALLGDPAVVVLDEPTAGIDPKERLSFYHVVRECFKEKSVLLSTHILDDMNHLADNVLMLKSGEVIYHGTYIDFVMLWMADYLRVFLRIETARLYQMTLLS